MRSPRTPAYSLLVVVLLLSAWVIVAQAAPLAVETYIPSIRVGGTPPPPDDSLTVDPQPDSGRAVAATIPLQGGEVVATAANGTRFTLSIPAGALAQTTTITLTPVSAVSGLPDVQLVGAVEIAPLNLWLLQAATLTITPPQAIPVAQEYPFAYYGDGQDFHPYPILPYDPQLIFPIGKFDGGYGIAQESTAAAVANLQAIAFTPAGAEAQLRAQISALIQAERENVLAGSEPDPTLWPKIIDLLMEFYNTSIKPLLQPSMTDCAFAEANMGKALSWLRTVTLLMGDSTEPGADARFAAATEEIMNAFIKSIENCYREAAKPCVDWEDPQQVEKVLRYYRMLLLLGAQGDVPAPEDLPECIYVDVRLQGGAFHYEFPKDPEVGYDSSVHFQFVDDTVSGFGIYYPYRSPSQAITPTAIVSITALIDGVWQSVPPTQRFFCRDQKAQRVEEVVVSFAQTSGGEPLPPQVYADNIGCWRWTGSYLHNQDYLATGGLKEYYFHVNGNFTLERVQPPFYFPLEDQGELNVQPLGYRYISGAITYDERLVHIDQEGNVTCVQTLSTTQSDLPAVAAPNFPALTVPNAAFGAPREIDGGLGSELKVDIPYQTQGTTCPAEGDSLDVISVQIKGELSADGRKITLDETGSLGEQSGTYHHTVDLQAQRE